MNYNTINFVADWHKKCMAKPIKQAITQGGFIYD